MGIKLGLHRKGKEEEKRRRGVRGRLVFGGRPGEQRVGLAMLWQFLMPEGKGRGKKRRKNSRLTHSQDSDNRQKKKGERANQFSANEKIDITCHFHTKKKG